MSYAIERRSSAPDRLLSAFGAIHWRNLPFMLIAGIGAVFMLLPFLWMFASSFRPLSEAYRLPPSFWPKDFDFVAYRTALDSGVPFLRMYLNSFIVAAASTIGVCVSCSLAAYAFARLRFPGQNLLFAMMLVGLMVPQALVLIPLSLGLQMTGLNDSLWALILPSLASPLGIYMVRQFMLRQPRELEEAAIIDGASHARIFWHISLPQLMPALSALAIITFTASWNNFLLPFAVIKSWDKMTLPVGILALQGTMGPASLAAVMAAMTMTILPLFIVFLVAQRYIVEGLTSTGIKG
mgnify:CR=1 FL=1